MRGVPSPRTARVEREGIRDVAGVPPICAAHRRPLVRAVDLVAFQPHEQIDLAPCLTACDNMVAVLVWYFGKEGSSHHDSGQGGLLFQADIVAGSTTRLTSDTGWKHLVHPGYAHDTTGTQPNFRLPESNVHYDARNAVAVRRPVHRAWSADVDPPVGLRRRGVDAQGGVVVAGQDG